MSADGERRSEGDRRGGERRGGGRRAGDGEVTGRFGLVPALWMLIGGLVVAYLFFVVLGGIDPGDAPAASIAALVLGVLWLAHSWRRLLFGASSPRGDRERRGF